MMERMCEFGKSPEQNDITPSRIYGDRRGNKFTECEPIIRLLIFLKVQRLYSKEFMGTNTPLLKLDASNTTLTGAVWRRDS